MGDLPVFTDYWDIVGDLNNSAEVVSYLHVSESLFHLFTKSLDLYQGSNVLFGKVNPGGKLTVTFPRSVGQLPVYYNCKPIVHERSFVEGTYSPLFPFGHGLSYTEFKYENIELASDKAVIGQSVKVSVDVTNTGDRAGDEVVQMYIRDMVSSVTRPVMELKDFKRVRLEKRQTKTVSFKITADKLQFYDIEMNRVVEPGQFQVMVGTSSAEYLTTSFELVK